MFSGLSADEIQRLLKLLAVEVIVHPTSAFNYTITKPKSGYVNGADGRLQAKLSMMLQAARERKDEAAEPQ